VRTRFQVLANFASVQLCFACGGTTEIRIVFEVWLVYIAHADPFPFFALHFTVGTKPGKRVRPPSKDRTGPQYAPLRYPVTTVQKMSADCDRPLADDGGKP